MENTEGTSTNYVSKIMNYGSPAAKAEILVKLILSEKPELVTLVYKAIGEKELNRIIGQA